MILRSAVGVWIWAALLNRPVLAALSAVFTLFTKKEGKVVRWWRSAWDEAQAMMLSMPLLVGDLGAPLLPAVFRWNKLQIYASGPPVSFVPLVCLLAS